MSPSISIWSAPDRIRRRHWPRMQSLAMSMPKYAGDEEMHPRRAEKKAGWPTCSKTAQGAQVRSAS